MRKIKINETLKIERDPGQGKRRGSLGVTEERHKRFFLVAVGAVEKAV